jgi:hypothetical protein
VTAKNTPYGQPKAPQGTMFFKSLDSIVRARRLKSTLIERKEGGENDLIGFNQ